RLQCDVFSADLVYQRDERSQASWFMQIPFLDLILFGIEIFLTAAFSRDIFIKLVRRSVDAVAGTECRRQDQSRSERGGAAALKVFVKNVGRVRPEVRTEEFAHFGLRQFREVVCKFLFCISPREVCIGLSES